MESKYIKEIEYIPSENLNLGTRNLGFKLEEAIKEYIDNEIDANAKSITIDIFENEYKILGEKYKNISDERLGIMISGDGDSFDESHLNHIFKLGKNFSKEYSSNKNGKFHYGIISGMGIGCSLTIMTKKKNEVLWSVKEIHYDELENSAYESELYKLEEQEVEEKLRNKNIEKKYNYGTMVIIEGIEKKKEKNIEKLIEMLEIDLGKTYYENLINLKVEILNSKIKTTNIKRIEPIGIELPEEVKAKVFAKYEILLSDIYEHVDNINKEKINEMREKNKEVEEEKIIIELYKLNINKENKFNVKRRYPEINGHYYPSPRTAGFYLKRINRLIGEAIGMEMFEMKNHPDYNLFRGLISFTPVFDEFFGVQINKNRNNITAAIVSIMTKLIREDNNLKGDSVGNRIKNSINDKKIDDGSIETGSSQNDEIDFMKANERVIKLKDKLIKYNQKTEILEKIEKMIKLRENIDEIKSKIVQAESEYDNKYKAKFKDIDSLITRVKDFRKLKILTEVREFKQLDGLREATLETDVYAWFWKMYILKPEIFPFKPILYYHNEGLDCVVELKDEVYDELKIKDRFGELYDKINYDLKIDEQNYSFIEFKSKLDRKIEYSLEFVSYIICWRKKRGLEEIETPYGVYKFIDENKEMLIDANGNKTKVIYLKDLIKKEILGQWQNGDHYKV